MAKPFAVEVLASKRFSTLENEYTALVFRACRLFDAGDLPALEKVRAKRDAIKAELQRRIPSFDRWEKGR